MSFPRYEKYKDSGVEWLGEVPEGWRTARLKHWADCLDGKRIPLNSEQRAERQGQVPYWGANCIVDFVDEALFDEDLVLLGEDGAPFFDRTKPVAFFSRGPIWPNNHVHILRPKGESDCKFMAYALNATDYADFIDGSTRDKLTQGQMVCIPLPSPSLPEQRTIAAFLDHETGKIDALVAEQEKLIGLLKEKRQAVISHAVTKGLDPNARMKDSGVEWLGEVPEGWEVIQSRRLFSQRKDRAHGSDKQLTASQKYGVIYQEDFMALEGQKVVQVIHGADILKHVEPNDFVISMRSFQGGIEWCGLVGSISSAYVMLIPGEFVSAEFFRYLFKSRTYIQALQSTTNLVRDGQALRFENFSLVDLPLLPLPEQRTIAAFLDHETGKIDALIEEAQRAIELMKERRTALISAAVTGKIDVSKAQ
ncbi:MAG: restriction endonuclease subunit S [Desulfomonilia bacterium]